MAEVVDDFDEFEKKLKKQGEQDPADDFEEFEKKSKKDRTWGEYFSSGAKALYENPGAALRAAGQGATFEFGDEILAGVNSLMPGSKGYQAELDNQRRIIDDAKKRLGDAYTLPNIAGGFAVPGVGMFGTAAKGAGAATTALTAGQKAAQIGKMAGVGAGYGATYNLGQQRDKIDLGEAAGAAVLGAGGALAIRGAGAAATGLSRKAGEIYRGFTGGGASAATQRSVRREIMKELRDAGYANMNDIMAGLRRNGFRVNESRIDDAALVSLLPAKRVDELVKRMAHTERDHTRMLEEYGRRQLGIQPKGSSSANAAATPTKFEQLGNRILRENVSPAGRQRYMPSAQAELEVADQLNRGSRHLNAINQMPRARVGLPGIVETLRTMPGGTQIYDDAVARVRMPGQPGRLQLNEIPMLLPPGQNPPAGRIALTDRNMPAILAKELRDTIAGIGKTDKALARNAMQPFNNATGRAGQHIRAGFNLRAAAKSRSEQRQEAFGIGRKPSEEKVANMARDIDTGKVQRQNVREGAIQGRAAIARDVGGDALKLEQRFADPAQERLEDHVIHQLGYGHIPLRNIRQEARKLADRESVRKMFDVANRSGKLSEDQIKADLADVVARTGYSVSVAVTTAASRWLRKFTQSEVRTEERLRQYLVEDPRVLLEMARELQRRNQLSGYEALNAAGQVLMQTGMHYTEREKE